MEPPPSVPKAVLPPRPAPPRRSPGDWTRLAEELGIEVPPEPEPEPEIPPPSDATVGVAEESDLDWRPPSTPRQPESRVERRREEPRRPVGERSREDDRRGRKRRRHRRPFEGEEKEGVGAGEPSDQPASFADEEYAEDRAADQIEVPASPAAAASPLQRREEGGRVRGRRRRRRKGMSPKREPLAPDEEVAVQSDGEGDRAAPATAHLDREEAEAPDDYDIADDDLIADEESESKGRSEKSLHRAIPSWFEAVNLVVSANLESRAKNPDRKSSGRPRGGHDRRGRDRGGDRPS